MNEKETIKENPIVLVIIAFLLLLIGFLIGVTDNSKIITSSVIEGKNVIEIRDNLEQFSAMISENERLVNELEEKRLKEEELRVQIDLINEQNEELRKSAIDLINLFNKELTEIIFAQPNESKSGSGGSPKSKDEKPVCTLICPVGKRLDPVNCICIPFTKPNPITIEKSPPKIIKEPALISFP